MCKIKLLLALITPYVHGLILILIKQTLFDSIALGWLVKFGSKVFPIPLDNK